MYYYSSSTKGYDTITIFVLARLQLAHILLYLQLQQPCWLHRLRCIDSVYLVVYLICRIISYTLYELILRDFFFPLKKILHTPNLTAIAGQAIICQSDKLMLHNLVARIF